jgi:hypothetical protein
MDSRLYFFLSYARLGPLLLDPPVSGTDHPGKAWPEDEPDPDVAKFFTDLDREVRLQAVATRVGAVAGFYDRDIPYTADPRRELTEALGKAQVLVPLYSPSYLTTSWTRREQEAFRIRMQHQGAAPDARVLSILWTPIPRWRVGPDDQDAVERARTLVPEIPEYAENGLRALCLLSTFRNAYVRVLGEIAARIVRLADQQPIPASSVPDLAAVPVPHNDDPSFVVAVFRHPPGEAVPPANWHPCDGLQALPVARLVARTAERLGLSPTLVDFDQLQRSSGDNPAVAVVDPGLLSRSAGAAELKRAFENLPVWVRPLVIGDSRDAAFLQIAHQAERILIGAVPPESRTLPRAVDLVDGPEQLEARLPAILTRARRGYLTFGEYSTQASTTPRQRLPRRSDRARGQDHDEKD